jgi:phosphatidylserine/phosphatidylglycerophosphate/cardiolipin synthase-like enzyme
MSEKLEGTSVRLLVQPGDGVEPLLQGINKAKNRVEIVIFRFDRREIEKAMINAVSRGVHVHALIAYTNRGGEKNLRDLEMRLLAGGVTVARTADDLVRYHAKYMIIDRRELYLLAFNFTYLDMERSRAFGLITQNRALVLEAVKLFESDTKRRLYKPGLGTLVVSPANARKQLTSFIKGAKKELLIYDPKIGDPAMIRLLEERAKAGVDVKVIGRMTRRGDKVALHKLAPMRLHTRTIIRDSEQVFIGSQSLRTAELDSRREVGIIFRERKIAGQLIKIFQDDWGLTEQSKERAMEDAPTPAAKVAKKVAKAVTKELPPVGEVLDGVVKEIVGENKDVEFNHEELQESVQAAVREAVKGIIQEVVEQESGVGSE